MIGSDFIKVLKPFVNFIPICPEVSIGLTVPREAIRLVREDGIKLLSSLSGQDHTLSMVEFTDDYLTNLKTAHGAILKSKSPTCGLAGVKVYPSSGKVVALDLKSAGLFGGQVKKFFPTIPIEDEGRLRNYNIRHQFLIRLFTFHRFKTLDLTIKNLQNFHKEHKYLFMMYNQKLLKEMGHLIGDYKKKELILLYNKYEGYLYELLEEAPDAGRVENTLLHVFGYFKHDLDHAEKAYFLNLIQMYKANQLPLVGITTVIQSWVIKYKKTYLESQYLFNPYPKQIIKLMDSGKGRV
jgi:uncharacterized protein YbgA (DUF1722 family)/uncharacterized protein YbbK (DUF523 family)